jgi:hypothetical protein
MRIGSDLPDDAHRATNDNREPVADLLSQAIREHVVADAPPDLDELMATVPRSPGWVGAVFGASAARKIRVHSPTTAEALLR